MASDKEVMEVVQRLKSEGIFDKFRKDCGANIDTDQMFARLKRRVEDFVARFLESQNWSTNKSNSELQLELRTKLNASTILQDIGPLVGKVLSKQSEQMRSPIHRIVKDYLNSKTPAEEEQEALATKAEGEAAEPNTVVSSGKSSKPESRDQAGKEKKDSVLTEERDPRLVHRMELPVAVSQAASPKINTPPTEVVAGVGQSASRRASTSPAEAFKSMDAQNPDTSSLSVGGSPGVENEVKGVGKVAADSGQPTLETSAVCETPSASLSVEKPDEAAIGQAFNNSASPSEAEVEPKEPAAEPATSTSSKSGDLSTINIHNRETQPAMEEEQASSPAPVQGSERMEESQIIAPTSPVHQTFAAVVCPPSPAGGMDDGEQNSPESAMQVEREPLPSPPPPLEDEESTSVLQHVLDLKMDAQERAASSSPMEQSDNSLSVSSVHTSDLSSFNDAITSSSSSSISEKSNQESAPAEERTSHIEKAPHAQPEKSRRRSQCGRKASKDAGATRPSRRGRKSVKKEPPAPVVTRSQRTVKPKQRYSPSDTMFSSAKTEQSTTLDAPAPRKSRRVSSNDPAELPAKRRRRTETTEQDSVQEAESAPAARRSRRTASTETRSTAAETPPPPRITRRRTSARLTAGDQK